jgi:hypothetical protein
MGNDTARRTECIHGSEINVHKVTDHEVNFDSTALTMT